MEKFNFKAYVKKNSDSLFKRNVRNIGFTKYTTDIDTVRLHVRGQAPNLYSCKHCYIEGCPTISHRK